MGRGALRRFTCVELEEAEPLAMLDTESVDRDDASEFLPRLKSELPEELSIVIEGLLAGRDTVPVTSFTESNRQCH